MLFWILNYFIVDSGDPNMATQLEQVTQICCGIYADFQESAAERNGCSSANSSPSLSGGLD